MNCNCNNKDGALFKPLITLVQGNLLRLAIPLTLRTIELVDVEVDGEIKRQVESTDTPFIPSSEYPVLVEFSKSARRYTIEAEMQGNLAYIEDKGKIPVGTYDITVTCNDDSGNPYRFKQAAVLRVVDTTKEAGIVSPIEYEVQTWYLDAAIYMALKGEDGVGVDDITVKQSTEIGGENIVTFHLSNGKTKSFSVLNGAGAVDDVLDENSPRPIANKTVTARFNALSDEIAGLFGYADYDTQSKTIRFWDKGRENVLVSLDARPFIKDGMVNSVYISNNTLVITFNTDSGREAIGVPLSSVFNPNNYYTKVQVDNRIATALANINLANYYTKAQVDDLVGGKMSINEFIDANTENFKANRATRVVLDYIVGLSDDEPEREIIPDGMWYENRQIWFAKIGEVDIEVVSLGAPSDEIVYANAEDDKLYRWTGRKWQQVGGNGSGNVQVQSDWNQTDTSSVDYIKNKPTIPVVPTNVSAFRNDAGYLTQHQDISGKVDKVQGKWLSSNDYTDSEKTKLAGIAEGATANVGTVTGIKYNDGNAISPVNGVVDLGTIITQHQSLGGKQDVISDLSTIRSGARKGATSVQSVSVNGGTPAQPDTNGNVDLQVSGGQGSNGFTINETATALVLTVWDGAELVETATSITIQQS